MDDWMIAGGFEQDLDTDRFYQEGYEATREHEDELRREAEYDDAICRHCDRPIIHEDGRWVDPEATGDDAVWRETCDRHDTFTAEHEATD